MNGSQAAGSLERLSVHDRTNGVQNASTKYLSCTRNSTSSLSHRQHSTSNSSRLLADALLYTFQVEEYLSSRGKTRDDMAASLEAVKGPCCC